MTDKEYPEELLPGYQLAVLNNFDSDTEWLLDKGDMLYLTPNMPNAKYKKAQAK